VFNVTKPALTQLSRAHAPRQALAVIAVGGCCAMLAACGSSGSSSAASSASSAASSASSAVASAASAVASAASSAASAASGVSAADCVIIKQVDSSAISTLLPMESESASKAAADMATYQTQLEADAAKLTSAKGKTVMGDWIADTKKAATESTADATTTITGGLAELAAACP
jgi:hypothetical protein